MQRGCFAPRWTNSDQFAPLALLQAALQERFSSLLDLPRQVGARLRESGGFKLELKIVFVCRPAASTFLLQGARVHNRHRVSACCINLPAARGKGERS